MVYLKTLDGGATKGWLISPNNANYRKYNANQKALFFENKKKKYKIIEIGKRDNWKMYDGVNVSLLTCGRAIWKKKVIYKILSKVDYM